MVGALHVQNLLERKRLVAHDWLADDFLDLVPVAHQQGVVAQRVDDGEELLVRVNLSLEGGYDAVGLQAALQLDAELAHLLHLLLHGWEVDLVKHGFGPGHHEPVELLVADPHGPLERHVLGDSLEGLELGGFHLERLLDLDDPLGLRLLRLHLGGEVLDKLEHLFPGRLHVEDHLVGGRLGEVLEVLVHLLASLDHLRGELLDPVLLLALRFVQHRLEHGKVILQQRKLSLVLLLDGKAKLFDELVQSLDLLRLRPEPLQDGLPQLHAELDDVHEILRGLWRVRELAGPGVNLADELVKHLRRQPG